MFISWAGRPALASLLKYTLCEQLSRILPDPAALQCPNKGTLLLTQATQLAKANFLVQIQLPAVGPTDFLYASERMTLLWGCWEDQEGNNHGAVSTRERWREQQVWGCARANKCSGIWGNCGDGRKQADLQAVTLG